ncbi:hypothetical protein MPSEU_000893900 [Mayamaea pseudoterrestris]|nr:hypothetical protein MPSEU_000893900 [Mayamaea pseudoterrestris]
MASPSRRTRVINLIVELQDAARRPLFAEIALVESARERRRLKALDISESIPLLESSIATAQKCTERTREQHSWEELLCEASRLAPFMTEQEHSTILHLASILTVGYLLPYSTGNEWYLLHDDQNAFKPDFDPAKYILNMPLGDRLVKSSRRYAVNDYGELNTLADASLEIACDSFLYLGLVPLLSVRQVSRDNVDLLHVFALGICPTCSAPMLPPATLQRLDQQNHPCWRQTKRLMHDNLSASLFELSYGTRLKLVQIVADIINIPTPLEERSSDVVSPLLFGALPHLRSSLHRFARDWAISNADADLAKNAAARLAQCNKQTLQEEWDFVLHNMCEGNICGCRGMIEQCYYVRQERLLSSLLVSSSIKSGLKLHIARSLADAVEWQLDLWMEEDIADTTDFKAKPNLISCLLTSLLSRAASCFRVFTGRINLTGDKVDDIDDAFDTLVHAGIHLMLHSNRRIASAAANMLLASLERKSPADDVPPQLFANTMAILSDDVESDWIRGLVAIASKRSRQFAASLLVSLSQRIFDEPRNSSRLLSYKSLVAVVALNCPLAVSRHADKIIVLLQNAPPPLLGGFDMLASCVSIRQACNIANSATNVDVFITEVLTGDKMNNWMKYCIARHAMLTGNCKIAKELFSRLRINSVISEKNYLWLSALEHFAIAESILIQKASKGIPEATNNLRSALTQFMALETRCGSSKETFAFQINFLCFRIDLLDMLTTLRRLGWELRLTESGRKKYTRTSTHASNASKGLIKLAQRLRTMIQCFGAQIRRNHSTVSLGLLRTMCLLLAKAARRTFTDTFDDKGTTQSVPGGFSAPMALLLQNLDSLLIEMDESVESNVRAHALVEMIDAILSTPSPVPIDIFAPLHKASVTLVLSADPENTNVTYDLHVIHASPALSSTFICSGYVPKDLLLCSTSILLIWYRLIFISPLDDEGGAATEDAQDFEVEDLVPRHMVVERLPNMAPYLPVKGSILTDGHFCFPIICPPIVDEGMFRIEVTVGCEDTASLRWRLRAPCESCFVDVHVQRSMDI